MIDKKTLSERDICSKFITPAMIAAGWDLNNQIREEVGFTKGRVIVRGKLHTRGEQKRADYILYYKPNIPIAVIEAKDNKHSVGAGMQQALNYAEILGIPFVLSSNGDGFLLHDRTGMADKTEQELALDAFPSPTDLWQRYCQWKGLTSVDVRKTVEMPYYDDGTSRAPRYYQANAINNTVEAVAKGQQRILLVMATGTGKTYTAFQIIWRPISAKTTLNGDYRKTDVACILHQSNQATLILLHWLLLLQHKRLIWQCQSNAFVVPQITYHRDLSNSASALGAES